MKLHCFVCASPLYPADQQRDEGLHVRYLEAQLETYPADRENFTLVQNGCTYPTLGMGCVRNPIPKNVAYNWLLCDANCKEEYWLFLPEDCRILPRGWEEIRKHTEKRKECFTLSRDPKVIICRRGIFQRLPKEIQTL